MREGGVIALEIYLPSGRGKESGERAQRLGCQAIGGPGGRKIRFQESRVEPRNTNEGGVDDFGVVYVVIRPPSDRKRTVPSARERGLITNG